MTKSEFKQIIRSHPTLTAWGQLPTDSNKYKRERERLMKAFTEFEISCKWLVDNGVPPWVDNSLQLKQLIQIGCEYYIPQGTAILALIVVFGIEPRTDTQAVWFKHFPEIQESQKANLLAEKQMRRKHNV